MNELDKMQCVCCDIITLNRWIFPDTSGSVHLCQECDRPGWLVIWIAKRRRDHAVASSLELEVDELSDDGWVAP